MNDKIKIVHVTLDKDVEKKSMKKETEKLLQAFEDQNPILDGFINDDEAQDLSEYFDSMDY